MLLLLLGAGLSLLHIYFNIFAILATLWQNALHFAGFAVGFQQALLEAGYDSKLTIIDDGDHGTVVDPLTDGAEVIATVLAISG